MPLPVGIILGPGANELASHLRTAVPQRSKSPYQTLLQLAMEIGENEHHQGDIAPGGDVIFLISPEKKRLRVYSLIIKHTSKVFAILFGPQFNEGQNLLNANAQTVEVLLPEDDPEAMAVICNVIHEQNDTIIELLYPTQILKISITADK